MGEGRTLDCILGAEEEFTPVHVEALQNPITGLEEPSFWNKVGIEHNLMRSDEKAAMYITNEPLPDRFSDWYGGVPIKARIQIKEGEKVFYIGLAVGEHRQLQFFESQLAQNGFYVSVHKFSPSLNEPEYGIWNQVREIVPGKSGNNRTGSMYRDSSNLPKLLKKIA